MSGKDEEGGKKPLPNLHGMLTPSQEDLIRAGRLPTDGSSELRPDQIFAARYRIIGKIGEGGAGFVYRAFDQVTKREIALKVIRADRAATPEARERLIEEAVIAREIRHRNVVAVFDAGEAEGQPYLTMELLTGTSLRTWMRTQLNQGIDCPMAAALEIVNAILDGLEAAHAMGVTHRDLKPENVYLVNPPGQGGVKLKLLDFGLALPPGQQMDSRGSKGTPNYMAPEQINAPESAKPSADLYALSRVFYELLAGVLPQDQWQPPSDGRSDVPQGVDELIRKGLSTIPRSRPQSVTDYRALLAAAMTPAQVAKPAPPAPSAPPAQPAQPQQTEEQRRKAEAVRAHNEALTYFDGESVRTNPAKARELFLLAAQNGHAMSMSNYAYMLEMGEGGPKDETTARDWFRKSAEAGFAPGMTNYANYLRLGRAGPKDEAGARKWYETAVRGGDTDAADRLRKMDEKPKPAPATADLVKRATALRDKAIGAIKTNPSDALAAWDEAGQLLKQAVQSGNAEAKLAYSYFLGESQMKPHRMPDNAASRAYAKSAADDGLREAMMRMGHDTVNGVWGPRDQAAALAWFEKAGAAGDSEGWRDAGNLVFSPYDDPPNHVRARDYWGKAAAMGNSAAMFQLGRLYGGDLWGQDTSRMLDRKLALEWFNRAEKAGYLKKYVDSSKKELGLG